MCIRDREITCDCDGDDGYGDDDDNNDDDGDDGDDGDSFVASIFSSEPQTLHARAATHCMGLMQPRADAGEG